MSKHANRLSRREFLTMAGLAASSLAIASCAPASAPLPAQAPGEESAAVAAGAPKRGGTLTVAIQNDWVTLDPIFQTGDPNGTNMLYGEWIKWDKDPETGVWGPHPEMVAEWDLQPDQAIFKLQEGVKFHDGTSWNAEAAKWNLDRMMFDPASTIQGYFRQVDKSGEDEAALEQLKETAGQTFDYSSKAVEIVDEYTVAVRLAAPMVTILSLLSNVMWNNNPISPTAYKEMGKQEFNRNPVGAGPFRFVEWMSGTHLILERNPDYWKLGEDGQPLPYLDQVVYRLIVDDSVRLLEAKSGNIHLTELIQGKDIADVKADPNLVFMESEASGNHYRMFFDTANPDSPLAKNVKVRQAMLFALDREAMLQTLGFGSGTVLKYLMPKGSWAYDDTVPFYAYDKAKAEQLLQEALAEDPSLAGADGKVPITLTAIERAVDKAQAEMIKQMADAVGFNVELEVLERAAFVAKFGGGGNFDAATVRNPVVPADPDTDWRLYYHSTGPSNLMHLNDPEWDRLIDEAASTYDRAKREEIYSQLAQKAYDEAWFGYLWKQHWNWVLSTQVQNFKEPLTNRHMYTEVWLA